MKNINQFILEAIVKKLFLYIYYCNYEKHKSIYFRSYSKKQRTTEYNPISDDFVTKLNKMIDDNKIIGSLCNWVIYKH